MKCTLYSAYSFCICIHNFKFQYLHTQMWTLKPLNHKHIFITVVTYMESTEALAWGSTVCSLMWLLAMAIYILYNSLDHNYIYCIHIYIGICRYVAIQKPCWRLPFWWIHVTPAWEHILSKFLYIYIPIHANAIYMVIVPHLNWSWSVHTFISILYVHTYVQFVCTSELYTQYMYIII